MKSILENVRRMYSGDTYWLIDSSKDPYRLNALIDSDLFEIRVLHIVKDPRSFVYSMMNNLQGFSRFRKMIRMSIRYFVQNCIIELVNKKLHFGVVKLINYEMLSSDPEKVIRDVSKVVSVEFDEVCIDRFGEDQHGISGNASRHKFDQGITLDSRWKTGLSWIERKLIWLIAGRLARKYGYKSRSLN